MSKVESLLACLTGAITALISVTDKLNLISILSSLVLGFVGAFGGWLFSKVTTYILSESLKSIRKIKQSIKKKQKKIK